MARPRGTEPSPRRWPGSRRARRGPSRARRWRSPSAKSAGGGMRTIGSSMHGSSRSGTNVRSAGTTTSSTWKWWLPVPHSPETCQVSSISTWSRANTAPRSCGTPSTIPSTQFAKNQAACSHPLANPHRPVTRYPPSTRVIEPVGLNAPAIAMSGPPAKIRSKLARGSTARSTQTPPPIIMVQPTEASARARDSRTCIATGTSAPSPPCERGSSMRMHPASISSSSRSPGIRRAASISAARAAMDGASSRTESRTSVAVVARRSTIVMSSSFLFRAATAGLRPHAGRGARRPNRRCSSRRLR